jgi:hypothetical protein
MNRFILVSVLFFIICCKRQNIDTKNAIIKNVESENGYKYALYNIEKGTIYLDYNNTSTGELIKFKIYFNNFGATQLIVSKIAGFKEIVILKKDSLQFNMAETSVYEKIKPSRREMNFLFEKLILNPNNYFADTTLILAKNLKTTYLGIDCWHYMTFITRTSEGELTGSITCWQNIPLEIVTRYKNDIVKINVTNIDFVNNIPSDTLSIITNKIETCRQ